MSSVNIEDTSSETKRRGFKKDSKNQLFLIPKEVGTVKEVVFISSKS